MTRFHTDRNRFVSIDFTERSQLALSGNLRFLVSLKDPFRDSVRRLLPFWTMKKLVIALSELMERRVHPVPVHGHVIDEPPRGGEARAPGAQNSGIRSRG